MARTPEEIGYVVSSDTVNPGYKIIPLGRRSDFYYDEVGVANPVPFIKGEIEQGGFSARLKRDMGGNLIGFNLMTRGKADQESARLLSGYFTSIGNETGNKVQEMMSPLISTCFISLAHGVIVQRRGEVGLVLKRDGEGGLTAEPYTMLTLDGKPVDSRVNFEKDPPEFSYEVAHIRLANSRTMDVESGVRFPQFDFKNMFNDFSILLARGQMTEDAIREYVDPFIRAKIVLNAEVE